MYVVGAACATPDKNVLLLEVRRIVEKEFVDQIRELQSLVDCMQEDSAQYHNDFQVMTEFLSGEVKAAEQMAASAEKDRKNIEDELVFLNLKYREQTKQLATATKLVEFVSQQNASQATELDLAAELATQEKALLSNQIRGLTKDKVQLEQQCQALNESRIKLEVDAASQKHCIFQLNTENARLRDVLAESQCTNVVLSVRLNEKDIVIGQLNVELEKKLNEIDRLLISVKELEEEVQELRLENTAMNTTLSTVEQDRCELVRKLKEAEASTERSV